MGDYNDWLTYDAQPIIAEGITQVQLLVNPKNDDIVAYMALCADSFLVASEEKAKLHLQSIPYSSFPALKIGKLAVDKRYRKKAYGSYMLW